MAERKKSKPVRVTRAEYYKGPLPHPSIVQKYEEILPGAADRIIKMAEEQAGHRQKLEKEITKSTIATEKRGMIFSFTITLLLMATGAILISENHEVAGFISLFAPSIFHAANFVYSKIEERKDPEN